MPVYKGKGDPLVSGSYRAIKLCLRECLKRRSDGNRTTDDIYIVQQVQEKHQAMKKLYYAFVDLEKVFDLCGKGVQSNSVKCTVCKTWIHKRRSCVYSDVLLVTDGCCCLPSETYGRNGDNYVHYNNNS